MTKTKNAVVNFRPLYEIGREIKRVWGKVYFGAVPYLDALCTLQDKNDTYGCDSAESIVIYFLGNASTFKGDDAKRLKQELKAAIK
jgi:hypothetical protein